MFAGQSLDEGLFCFESIQASKFTLQANEIRGDKTDSIFVNCHWQNTR